MKPQTLKYIKTQVKPLIKLLVAYRETKGIKEGLLTALIVELQNFCRDWEHCHGYTYAEDFKRCNAIYAFLEEVGAYEKEFHFIQYLVAEFSMIYDGNSMHEDYMGEQESTDILFP